MAQQDSTITYHPTPITQDSTITQHPSPTTQDTTITQHPSPITQDTTITQHPTPITQDFTRYDRRIHRYRKHWAALIPTQYVIQNAGNMGVLSAGIGWDYGRRGQWETHLLLGYIPEHMSNRGKLTMTLKENFIPFSLALSSPRLAALDRGGLSVEPLSVSIYLNTVYGHEFWKRQPHRYPDKYYDFMSTKFRLNLALGQRLTWQIPNSRRRAAKSVTLFYELSSCDLYIRSKIIDGTVPLKDIVGLSIGLKLQTL